MFKINKTIGREYAVDLQDIPPTKKALMRLGLYEVPSYGMNTYPDEAMFGGIERFQPAQGLRKDGVMKPGGETERAFAVNLLDADESNIAPAEQVTLGGRQLAARHAGVTRANIDLRPWLAVLALLVLCLEWYVYNRKVHI